MILIVCFCCFACGAVAQQTDISSKLPSHWYIGASGGVGFAQSTFSSFAFNSIYPGAATSLFAGYSFNNLLALELGLSYDWLKMGAAPCCQYLWLSENIKSFFAPVAGQKNWAYSKLNSITHLAALDVCLNFDLLRSFMPHSQWILQLSPSISANLSSASLMTDNQTPIHSANSWHFGAGGDVAVGYSLNSAVDIKLFAGAQYLFGGAFDALPQSHHHNGFVCHSGVSFCYHFPKSKPRISNEISVNPITPSTTITHSTTRTPSTPAVQEVFTSPDTIPQIVDTIPQIQPQIQPQFQPEIPIVEPTDSMVEYDSIVSQNVIYYSSGSFKSIEKSQHHISWLILQDLLKYPDSKVIINGWSDKDGAIYVNQWYSEMRATAVAIYLEKRGVSSSRIFCYGKGVDKSAKTNDEARRADVLILLKCKK